MLQLSLLIAFCTSLSSLVFAINMAVDSSSEHPPRPGGHWARSLHRVTRWVRAVLREGAVGPPRLVCAVGPHALAVRLG